jgi:hypothetical protein
MGMKQNIFFLKKKIKMADSKKLRFSKLPILKKFLRKLHRFFLGLVGLIDVKGIDVAQPIGHEAVCHKLKNSSKTQKMQFKRIE